MDIIFLGFLGQRELCKISICGLPDGVDEHTGAVGVENGGQLFEFGIGIISEELPLTFEDATGRAEVLEVIAAERDFVDSDFAFILDEVSFGIMGPGIVFESHRQEFHRAGKTSSIESEAAVIAAGVAFDGSVEGFRIPGVRDRGFWDRNGDNLVFFSGKGGSDFSISDVLVKEQSRGLVGEGSGLHRARQGHFGES